MNEKYVTEVFRANKVKDTIHHKTLERYCITFLVRQESLGVSNVSRKNILQKVYTQLLKRDNMGYSIFDETMVDLAWDKLYKLIKEWWCSFRLTYTTICSSQLCLLLNYPNGEI